MAAEGGDGRARHLVAACRASLRALGWNARQPWPVAAAFLNSTLSSSQVSDRLGRAQRGELKLLYVAPERLLMSRE